MHITIALIVSLCANVSTTQVQAKLAELQAKNPSSKISVRLDKKCRGAK